MISKEYKVYCKDKELEYRRILPDWLKNRNNKDESIRDYCHTIIRNIRAYKDGENFKKYPARAKCEEVSKN